jgi:hypothetical protein
MPRGRRLISPATACGVALLAMMLAAVLITALSAQHNTITGLAVAADEPSRSVHSADSPAGPDGGNPTGSATPGTTAPGSGSSPGPAAGQAPPSTHAPTPPGARPAGSILLTHGGTAILVRRDVGTDGVLPIPSSILQASWWGAGLNDTIGATVLAGHVNWHGATGPFAELWKSKVGDPVLLVDQTGQATTYHVSQVITLAKNELAQHAEELFSQDGPHRLVLVTCAGQWVGGTIGYASNQIVIATH